MEKKRCAWVNSDQLYIKYHDEEWGVPVHNDRKLFEFLILEGAQAGLSWITILKKREAYRKAFDNFDPERVALYDEKKFEELLNNSGIVRNRLKIKAAIKNAQAFLEIQKEFGSFNEYIWSFVGAEPIMNNRKNTKEIPPRTELSDKISKDLKQRGFSFVGTTIIYAFMQAMGMVNDHTLNCWCFSRTISK